MSGFLGVGIVGCGLIGQKRANAIGKNGKILACADIDIKRAEALANKYNCIACADWNDILKNDQIDVVIIATLHDSLAEITSELIKANKHVLVEKPAARNVAELKRVMDDLNESKSLVHVGFNHRYHRSVRKAKEIVDSGELGELMFIRGRYGHGGRIGYDKEWRANPALSGGGELIDQGPHLIDLSRWFMGEFVDINGFASTFYWDMPVDDNAFMTLKTEKNQVAFLHVSCTEWKNQFSMEIYGKNGKIELSGLGGSYGLEKITYYKMLPEMGPPETYSWEYPMADDSWSVEIEEFFEDIRLNRAPSASIVDAYESMKIVEKISKESGYDYSS